MTIAAAAPAAEPTDKPTPDSSPEAPAPTPPAARVHLFLALTGGAHSTYMTTNIFDRAKWNAKMQTFNTPAIYSAGVGNIAPFRDGALATIQQAFSTVAGRLATLPAKRCTRS